MIKNKLFVKGGCPFSYKFIIFLNEINKLEDFDINVAHADEPSYEEITMYILKKSGQKASFPGDILSQYKTNRDNIKMLNYWEKNMMPRMRNVIKQLREANERIESLS